MASAAEPNTVWVGFMDFIPVIGTVKEMVEWILALYEGNKKVFLDKQKALFECCFGSPEAALQEWKEKPEVKSEGAEASKSALLDIKEIKQGELLAFLSCTKESQKKKSAQMTQKMKAEKEQKLEKIKKDLVEKILPIIPDYRLAEPLKEELSRSKQSEHVFNKDILKFHSKVLKEFLDKNSENENVIKITSQVLFTEQQFLDFGTNTLDRETRKEIQTNMKVDFDEDEFYVNANSILYGVYCKVLRSKFIDIMLRTDPGSVPRNLKKKLVKIINCMNKFEIYVDHFAKEKWIKETNITPEERFNFVKDKVAHMYTNERGFDWISDVMMKLTNTPSTALPSN